MSEAKAYATAKNLGTLGPGRWSVENIGGLYLVVTGSGSRSWIYRFNLGGRQKEMGLGSLDDVKTIERARRLRDDAADLKAQGINPIEARRRRAAENAAKPKAAKTFEECAKPWHAKLCEESDSPAYSAQAWRQLAAYAFPKIGKTPVNQITTDSVLDILRPQWATKNPTMSKLRGYIEGVLHTKAAREARDGRVNPAAWSELKGDLSRPSLVHSVKPHAAVAVKDIPGFMAALRSRTSTSARLLEFTILTAARTEESLYAKVGEVNESVWTVPAVRMKGRKNKRTDHRVPLSDRAMAIYRELAAGKKADDYLFSHPDGAHLSTGAMDKMMELMGVAATPHGTARSSFRTWSENAPEAKTFREAAAKAALHHSLGDKVDLAYQRGDLLEHRAELMQAWANYCGPRPADNVVALRAAIAEANQARAS